MADLIKILESFNRKERFFLISHALSGRQDEPKFTLSENFRQELGKAVGLEEKGIKIPACAFAAMDYHLDWVAASLAKWESVKAGKVDDSVFPNSGQEVVEGNQEDIDLLVAFDCEGKHRLIFVEAKAYGSWGNKQLKSKVARLERIFGADGGKCDGVVPHFSLMSPNSPQKLSVQWLKWMLGGNCKPHHLKMSLPPKNERRIVERYAKDDRKASAEGDHFHIRSL